MLLWQGGGASVQGHVQSYRLHSAYRSGQGGVHRHRGLLPVSALPAMVVMTRVHGTAQHFPIHAALHCTLYAALQPLMRHLCALLTNLLLQPRAHPPHR